MKPQSNLKKYLLPGAIIIAVVIVGVLVFMRDGAADQGASLFRGVNKTNSLKVINNAVQYPGSSTNLLPCSKTNKTPVIKVFSPNGGEAFAAGQQVTVKWSSCNIPATGNSISIQLRGGFPGSAVNFMELAPSNYSINDGTETITLPTKAINSFMQYGNNFKIKVWIDGYAQDESDNLFTITGRVCKPTDPLSIRVDSPNGGEVFKAGQMIPVTWSTCGGRSDDTAKISISTSYGQGGSLVLATVPENLGYTTITLPGTIGNIPVVAGSYYKIKIDYLDNVPGGSLYSTDSSNASFTIQ